MCTFFPLDWMNEWMNGTRVLYTYTKLAQSLFSDAGQHLSPPPIHKSIDDHIINTSDMFSRRLPFPLSFHVALHVYVRLVASSHNLLHLSAVWFLLLSFLIASLLSFSCCTLFARWCARRFLRGSGITANRPVFHSRLGRQPNEEQESGNWIDKRACRSAHFPSRGWRYMPALIRYAQTCY